MNFDDLQKSLDILISLKQNIKASFMLSYQHSYHAGNLADVHKHALLTLLLKRLVDKPKPLTYFETHAGRGFYDLNDPHALKTKEAAHGIERVLEEDALKINHPYVALILKIRRMLGATKYPGSPMIAASLLRSIDKMVLNELHPEEFRNLDWRMKKMEPEPKCQVMKQDGLKAALKWAPPNPTRGVVLIDPSYEIKQEYLDIPDFIQKLHKKWPVGVIVLWYPILDDERHQEMASTIDQENYPNFYKSEVRFSPVKEGHRLVGSGMMIINSPYELDIEMNAAAHMVSQF